MKDEPPTDVEMRARLTLTGEIDLQLGQHGLLALTTVEATTAGTFRAPEPPFRLTLGGPFAELRKLRAVSASLARVLDLQADAPEGAEGRLALTAPAPHRARLAAALAKHADEPTPDELMRNAEWLAALFALDQYEAESIGTVTRG